MASVKSLKKDIQFLSEIVISDAISVGGMLEKEEDKAKATEVIVEAVAMCNELIARVNHPDGKDNPQIVKQYYKKISVELMDKSNAMFTTLNDLLGV